MEHELSDTDPETERVHLELLRSASPGRRIRLALSLSRTVMSLSRGGLARSLPGASAQELGLRFVELHYGAELADELRAEARGAFGNSQNVNDPDLLAALTPVLQAFRTLGVRHLIGGSIASSAHGVARASVDADIVAELGPAHVGPLVAALRDGYYVPEERIRDAVARKASFNLIHLDTMLKVDVFVSRDRPFDRRAFERSGPAPMQTNADMPFPVASAEDIMLAKLEWYRRGGEASQRQWTDVIGVLQASAGTIDLPYLRRGAVELEVGDLLERALEEAEVDTTR